MLMGRNGPGMVTAGLCLLNKFGDQNSECLHGCTTSKLTITPMLGIQVLSSIVIIKAKTVMLSISGMNLLILLSTLFSYFLATVKSGNKSEYVKIEK